MEVEVEEELEEEPKLSEGRRDLRDLVFVAESGGWVDIMARVMGVMWCETMTDSFRWSKLERWIKSRDCRSRRSWVLCRGMQMRSRMRCKAVIRREV